jgi:hypothetical protein
MSLYVTIIDDKKKKYLLFYIFCSLLIAGIGLLIFNTSMNNKWIYLVCFPYTSPLVVISSIAFFLWFKNFIFTTIKINKIINWAASSALSIYLIHENGFSNKVYRYYIYELGQQTENGFLLAFYLVFIALGVMVVCILIDKIRMLITNPIERIFNRIKWDVYTNWLISKITETK